MKKTLLILAAVVGLGGCISLKTHREAVKMAEMRGRLEGQDQVLPLVRQCLSVKADDSMDDLASQAAKQTDKEVGPPPAYHFPLFNPNNQTIPLKDSSR